MGDWMNDYLNNIDKYLRAMPVSDRVDIMKEIKSEMIELKEVAHLSADQILERLGSPKELAKAYLADFIAESKIFSLHKFSSVIAFYSLAGISGMFVLPFASVLSVSFLICSVIVPIGGVIKLLGSLVGFNVPFVVIQMGDFTASPVQGFLISIVAGVALFFAGKGVWKLMLRYIKYISKKKSVLLQ